MHPNSVKHAHTRRTVKLEVSTVVFVLTVANICANKVLTKRRRGTEPMTTDLHQIAADLETQDYVASANVWKDRRVYVNLANTDDSFRGDRNAKIYFERGEWHVDHGKGVNSHGYDTSFNAFHAAHIA